MINKPQKVSETLLHHSRVQPAPAICLPVHLAQLARQPFRHQSDLPADVNLGVSKCDPFRAHALKKILITQKGLLRQCIPQTYMLKGMIDMRRARMLCRETDWKKWIGPRDKSAMSPWPGSWHAWDVKDLEMDGLLPQRRLWNRNLATELMIVQWTHQGLGSGVRTIKISSPIILLGMCQNFTWMINHFSFMVVASSVKCISVQSSLQSLILMAFPNIWGHKNS